MRKLCNKNLGLLLAATSRSGSNNLIVVLNRLTSVYMLSTYIGSNGTALMSGDMFTHINNHILF
jgi:hypothetical protein